MTDELPYKNGSALWEAAAARAKTLSQSSGVTAAELLRRFAVDRFLARVRASR